MAAEGITNTNSAMTTFQQADRKIHVYIMAFVGADGPEFGTHQIAARHSGRPTHLHFVVEDWVAWVKKTRNGLWNWHL